MKRICRFTKIISFIIFAFLSSNLMAFEFPALPGTGDTGDGSNGSITSNGSLIFICDIAGIGNTDSNNSSCSNTGGNSSTCDTSTTGSSSVVKHWESSVDPSSALKLILDNAVSCVEAVEAAGNCQASAAGNLIIYNCDI